jgi:nucleoside-diphosphate-sugar epimerase
MMMKKTALIFGISGIIGRALAEHLSRTGKWDVIGVSRHGARELTGGGLGIKGAKLIKCDLNNPAATAKALQAAGAATHAFYATWSRQENEAENCRVNGAMIRAALEGATAHAKLRHVALVTGLKHYLGSFENYAAQELDTPFTEDQKRLPGDNFYYTQEDVLFELAAKRKFSWSVARPHTVIGYAPGNAMNLGTSIAVYATLCRETGRPFRFPGSPQSYNGLVDMTDAGILARHLEWEAVTKNAADQAFNVVNGDTFRWRKMWRLIAAYFGVEPASYPGYAMPLANSVEDVARDWQAIVKQYRLMPNPIKQVAPWWHVDADLGRTQECVTDMSKSRELGFLQYQRTFASFETLFARLRKERIIP